MNLVFCKLLGKFWLQKFGESFTTGCESIRLKWPVRLLTGRPGANVRFKHLEAIKRRQFAGLLLQPGKSILGISSVRQFPRLCQIRISHGSLEKPRFEHFPKVERRLGCQVAGVQVQTDLDVSLLRRFGEVG